MRRRGRGSAMALYAAFLACVGIPLLVVSVDLSRMMERRVRLANAVETACTAYVHTPDVEALKMDRGLVLGNEARILANQVFLYGQFENARLTRLSYRLEPASGNVESQVLIATCGGEAEFRPIILGGRVIYTLRHTVTVKAKSGDASNW